jgi:hypothetical protein
MSGKCAAYWRAREQGKDCGVPQSRVANAKQNRYIRDIVPDLVSMGAREDDVLDLFKYTHAWGCSRNRASGKKAVSIASLKRSSPIRMKMLDFIFRSVVEGKEVTVDTLCAGGFDLDKWALEDYVEHYEHVPQNKRIVALAPPKKLDTGHTKSAITCTIKNPIPHAATRASNGQSASVSVKKSILAGLCTSGQIGILQDMNLAGFGDDEYTAFCIAIKWAWERLESEKIKVKVDESVVQ